MLTLLEFGTSFCSVFIFWLILSLRFCENNKILNYLKKKKDIELCQYTIKY